MDKRRPQFLTVTFFVVIGMSILGFTLGTRWFFAAGAVIVITFGFAVGNIAIERYRTGSKRNTFVRIADTLPYISSFLLSAVFLYIIVREFLR